VWAVFVLPALLSNVRIVSEVEGHMQVWEVKVSPAVTMATRQENNGQPPAQPLHPAHRTVYTSRNCAAKSFSYVEQFFFSVG